MGSQAVARSALLGVWLSSIAHGTLAQPVASESSAAAGEMTQSTSAPFDAEAARRTEAEQRRQQALIFYDSGDYVAARREFERANQLLPSFRLLYNLGVVSMALADPSAACGYFERYLAEGGAEVAPNTRAYLLRQLSELAHRIALVVVVVDAQGAAVSIDGTLVGVSPLSGPVRVNPGSHQVTARLENTLAASHTLSIGGGETARVQLELSTSRQPVVPPPSAPQRQVFWAGWAATAALTTGAVVSGFQALSAHRSYQDAFDGIGTSRAELDVLDARATRWSIAADALGGAAIVVGAYSLYRSLQPSSPAAAAGATSRFSVGLSANHARLGIEF